MEWVETAGRTLAEAKDAALDQLGVDETDAEFVVVSEPKVGLFGRTRGEARVRARVRPTQPRPKRGRERRTGGGRSRSSSGSDGGGRRSAGARIATKDDPVKRAPANGSSPADPGGGEDADGGGASSGAGTRTGNRRRRGGRGRGGNRPPGAGAGATTEAVVSSPPAGAGATSTDGAARTAGASTGNGAGPRTDAAAAATRSAGRAEQTDTTDKENPVVEMSLDQQGEAARRFVADLVQTLGLTASVDAQPADEETVAIAVEGEGVATLIGPGGSTLQALQELTRTYVQKLTGGQSDRILVDVAGYRARRVAALQRFTEGVAHEVVASGEARALEPMSAADRKVVHDTVNGINGVSTRSEGEDPRRYIVIIPDASEGEG